MIIYAGGRTDIVQYYTEWLVNRFEEGYVLSRNPIFKNKVTRYELAPDKVDCAVFCSKNYKPFLPHVQKIADSFNTYFHYTITAYGKDLEPGVPSIEESIETLYELERLVGARRILWRYDPVLLTKDYTVDRHIRIFEYMAERLNGHVERCAFNFVEEHKKTGCNIPELVMLNDADRKALAEGFGGIAEKAGMVIQTCGLNGDYRSAGVLQSGCITLDILGAANDVRFKKLKHKGLRQGCGCVEVRDIGAYDTCRNGCKYCYANKNQQKAFDNFKQHNPDSPLLLGELKPTDTVQKGSQKSFLKI